MRHTFIAAPDASKRRRCPAPPMHVTNQGKEMRVAKLLEEAGLIEDDYIVLDPDNPVPNPELGPLERRVSTTFEEGLIQEEIDTEAMKFWFTEPPEGWNQEKRRLKKAQVLPTEDIDEFRHADTSGRRLLTEIKVGEILHGTVVSQLFYHGFQIDIGAEADGLICVSEKDAWRALGDEIPEVGDAVEVIVHAVHLDPIYRFPLQLMPTNQRFASRLPNPDDYISPLDLRDVKLSEMADVAKRTGRTWEPTTVIVPQREEGTGATLDYDALELSEEEMLKLDDIAAM